MNNKNKAQRRELKTIWGYVAALSAILYAAPHNIYLKLGWKINS